MIGVLCSDGKGKAYAARLHYLFKEYIEEGDNPIVVFTIDDIDIKNKKVSGSMLLKDGIKRREVPLPPIVYNFSLQRKKQSIIKLRALTDMSGLTIINEINRFNQLMIKQMLLSSGTTAKYILPYNIYDKEKRDYRPDDDKSYLVMPAKGSSMSRVIYAKQSKENDYVEGSQYFRKGHICDYIDASMCQKRWVFLEIPDIVYYDNLPVIARVYVQKDCDGLWNVIGKNIYPKVEESMNIEVADNDVMTISNYIGKFLPGMGVCFIDFVMDTERKPYFLHFGGFDGSLLNIRGKGSHYEQLYRGLIRISGDGESKREGE